ncbi:MAG: TspO/MBR family protein, partial [Clostridia bacterium]
MKKLVIIMWQKIKPFILYISITLAVGTLAGLLTMNSTDIYNDIKKPDFSPPSWIFPVVWSFLYVLMGFSAALVSKSNSPVRKEALIVYWIQLAVNFIWPILFFNYQAFGFSFAWILFLIVLVTATI